MPSRLPTTNSSPSNPGIVVRNETVPSGFLREATSLLNSPKSKTCPLSLRDDDLTERVARVARGSFATSAGSGGTVRSLRSAAIRSFIALAAAATSLSASGLPSNSTSRSLRRKLPEIAPPGRRSSARPRLRRAPAATSCRSCSRSCRRRGARPACRRLVHLSPMPYQSSLPIQTFGSWRAFSTASDT